MFNFRVKGVQILFATILPIMLSIMLPLLVLLFSNPTLAATKVDLEVVVEKDIVEVDKKGKKVIRRVIAAETVPGDILFYTLRYSNSGDEAASKVQLDNPIPKGTAYQANSAWGDKSEILFSVDEGKSFKKASNLTYEVKGADGKLEVRQVAPEQYKVIRWIVDEVPAKGKGTAGFSVLVQ